ncbi:universal stress protein [Arthrobacter pigmenti]
MTSQSDATRRFTPRPTDVVVGIDGSDTSSAALAWALREAQLREARLRLITAYGMPLLENTSIASAYREVHGKLRDIAADTVRSARAEVSGQGVEVVGAVIEGDAAGALISAAETAGLLVVGSRGLGGFTGRLLGSVSSALPGHAQCPVVVIPGAETKGRHKNRSHSDDVGHTGVVAGIDGSEPAAAAALDAAEYAHRRGLPLTLLRARPPVESYIPLPLTEWELEGLQSGIDSEAAWLGRYFPELNITARITDRQPVEVLANASDTAELVVLGNRGRGGFASLVLGSTSRSVVHHALGPVMIVPHDAGNPDARLSDRTDPEPDSSPAADSSKGS